jgi:CubicO group peptidase (beta-lactamase class C family)
VLKAFETPGMAVAIVERGRPAVVRTYGSVARASPRRSMPQRCLRSARQQGVHAAVLATLVDEGKLTWDTKVSDVLPGFKMHDAYVSSEMTVRDLLVHRSGLGQGAGDLMFYPPSNLSRADIVHRLRYIPPASSFRSTFAYSNLMYVVAGEVIEAVSGQPWEVAVRKRILDPLGMSSTTTTVPGEGANYGWPHARTTSDLRGDGPVVALGAPIHLDNAAAAGALNTSATDVARWLELQLGRGLDPKSNTRVFSETQARELWKAQTILPVPPNPKGLELAQAHLRAYTPGWITSDYRGEQILAHGGGVPGTVVLLCIVPNKDVAFACVRQQRGTRRACVDAVPVAGPLPWAPKPGLARGARGGATRAPGQWSRDARRGAEGTGCTRREHRSRALVAARAVRGHVPRCLVR